MDKIVGNSNLLRWPAPLRVQDLSIKVLIQRVMPDQDHGPKPVPKIT